MGNLAVYVLDTNVEVYLLEDGELKAEQHATDSCKFKMKEVDKLK